MSGSRVGAPACDATRSQGWEAFRTNEPKMKAEVGWTLAPIPPELKNISNESVVPEKLRQILAWSQILTSPPHELQRRQSINDPHGKFRQSEHGRQYGAEARRTPNDQLNQHPVPDQDLKGDAVSGLHSPCKGDSPESPSTSAIRPTIPRSIGHSVLGSTLDFLAALKRRPEKDRSATSETKKATSSKDSLVECTSCFDEITTAAATKLACTHSYCKLCLTTLITTALRNEASYPPKCCLTPIPLHTALLLLTPEQREVYTEKAAEYDIPPQDRWYCPNPQCLKWIPPRKHQRKSKTNQTCPHCAAKICPICRGAAHRQLSDCPRDSDLNATLTLAELEGWHRCHKCKAMVEVCAPSPRSGGPLLLTRRPLAKYRLSAYDMQMRCSVLLYLRCPMAYLQLHGSRRSLPSSRLGTTASPKAGDPGGRGL